MKSYGSICKLTAALVIVGVYAHTQARADDADQTNKTAEPAVSAQQTRADDANVVHIVSQTDRNDAKVSMTFDEMPLSDVIKAFRDATSANIISGGTNLSQTVSVRLDNVPWQKGLSSILEPQGMRLVEKPAGSEIYLVEDITVVIPKITRTFQLDNAAVKDVEELFNKVLGENGNATAFPSANSIIVTAPEKEITECEIIIKAIDSPARQVYIEARFVEMSAAASKQLGLKWDSLNEWGVNVTDVKGGMAFNDSKIATYPTDAITTEEGLAADSPKRDMKMTLVPEKLTGSTLAGTTAEDMTWRNVHAVGGMINLDDFRLAMSAFESVDGIKIFSNPKVIVSNEKKAKIDMTQKIPNVEVNYQAATTEGQRDSVSTKLALIPGKNEPFVSEAFFSYGISLEVTPRISSSDLITVDIEPTISDLQGWFELGAVDNIPVSRFPIIDMRRIQTTFSMQSGKTAVIGGLSITKDGNIDSGIPLLRHIPWVGPRVFGWKSRQKEQKEIVIFVTVGIADPLTIEEDAGMPRNAVLSRDVMDGKIKEPYQMTREELFGLSDKKLDFTKEPDAAEQDEKVPVPETTELERVQVSVPETVEPEEVVTEQAAAELQPLLAD